MPCVFRDYKWLGQQSEHLGVHPGCFPKSCGTVGGNCCVFTLETGHPELGKLYTSNGKYVPCFIEETDTQTGLLTCPISHSKFWKRRWKPRALAVFGQSPEWGEPTEVLEGTPPPT